MVSIIAFVLGLWMLVRWEVGMEMLKRAGGVLVWLALVWISLAAWASHALAWWVGWALVGFGVCIVIGILAAATSPRNQSREK